MKKRLLALLLCLLMIPGMTSADTYFTVLGSTIQLTDEQVEMLPDLEELANEWFFDFIFEYTSENFADWFWRVYGPLLNGEPDLPGDVDGNRLIDLDDVWQIYRMAMKREDPILYADINGDSVVNLHDAVAELQVVCGYDNIPAGTPEPSVTQSPTVTPAITKKPTPTPSPTVKPTSTPEQSTVIPLAVNLSSPGHHTSVSSVTGSKECIKFTTEISGGSQPYTCVYRLYKDNKEIYSNTESIDAGGIYDLEFESKSWPYGKYTCSITVKDAAGQTVSTDSQGYLLIYENGIRIVDITSDPSQTTQPTATPTQTAVPTASPTPKPVVTPAPTSPTQLDPQQIYQAMIAMKADYPEGMPWTNADSYVWKATPWNFTYTGYGCVAFAFILSDAAFGTLPYREFYSVDEIRVGDIIRINNDSHSVIILEVHNDYFIIAEGNYNRSIHWGRRINRSEMERIMDFGYTRYPQ